MYYDCRSTHLIETSVLLDHLLLLIFNDLLIVDFAPVSLIDILVLVLVIIALESCV
jgi:hypothetical protein